MGKLRTGDGLLRTGEGLLRTGEGLLRTGEGLLRTGEGLLRTGELLRAGDWLVERTWLVASALETKSARAVTSARKEEHGDGWDRGIGSGSVTSGKVARSCRKDGARISRSKAAILPVMCPRGETASPEKSAPVRESARECRERGRAQAFRTGAWP